MFFYINILYIYILYTVYISATLRISEDQFSREVLKMTLDMHETL